MTFNTNNCYVLEIGGIGLQHESFIALVLYFLLLFFVFFLASGLAAWALINTHCLQQSIQIEFVWDLLILTLFQCLFFLLGIILCACRWYVEIEVWFFRKDLSECCFVYFEEFIGGELATTQGSHDFTGHDQELAI